MKEEKDVIIDLKLNDNLIPQGHFMRYQSPNGTDVVQYFTKTDIDLCHYKVRIICNHIDRHKTLIHEHEFIFIYQNY